MQWRVIMNTRLFFSNNEQAKTKQPLRSSLLNMEKKPTYAASIFIACMAFSVNTHANDNDTTKIEETVSNTPTTRSITVDYANHPHKLAQGKFDNQKNEAQLAAFEALNTSIDGVTSTEQKQALNTQISLHAKPDLLHKTRDEVIAYRKQQSSLKVSGVNKAVNSVSTQSNFTSNSLEFDIYSATTVLFDDVDYDGFYQTFSVTFDADVYGPYLGQRARVFADMYLSKDGGPWQLYFTTEAFTIVDDITDDEFEVLTTLDAGYSTEHYDVLIDVYEVGFSDIVATISSEDLDSLYALPLESADRDRYEEVSVSTSVGISAGSTTFFSIVGLGLIVLMRGFKQSSSVI